VYLCDFVQSDDGLQVETRPSETLQSDSSGIIWRRNCSGVFEALREEVFRCRSLNRRQRIVPLIVDHRQSTDFRLPHEREPPGVVRTEGLAWIKLPIINSITEILSSALSSLSYTKYSYSLSIPKCATGRLPIQVNSSESREFQGLAVPRLKIIIAFRLPRIF
jgi:hypothetical protein